MTPAPPRPAATVVLLRDAESGPELLLLRRPPTGFAADVWVFPGGAVDTEDYRLPPPLAEEAARWAGRMGIDDPADAWAFVVAALRETWEETGLLLGAAATSAEAVEAARRRLLAGAVPFLEAASLVGFRPSLDSLVYFARWVTPPSLSKRYDTRFFVAPVHSNAAVTLPTDELLDAIWVRPEEAVHMHETKVNQLMIPTLYTVRRLVGFRSVAGILGELALDEPRSYLPGMRGSPEGVIIERDAE